METVKKLGKTPKKPEAIAEEIMRLVDFDDNPTEQNSNFSEVFMVTKL